MINLMDEYIKAIKINMNNFLKICLDTKYIKKIADEFIDTYTEIRYFGLIEAKKGLTVKNKLLTQLKSLKEDLISEEEKKAKNIELTYIFFDSCSSLNEKTEKEEIAEEIEQIMKLRKQHLGIEPTDDYRNLLNSAVIDADLAKEKVLDKAESNEFYLKFTNYKTTNLKRVILKHNIKFPAIYSNDLISKTFDSGTVSEDKLFIEFFLIALQVIKDLEQSNYRKQYVADFTDSILDKPQKLARLMEIMNNPSIQDRVMLNINYSTVVKSRESIYELLRNGYKIALTLDEEFEPTEANIQRLAMFQYILVDASEPYYKELAKRKAKNLIEV